MNESTKKIGLVVLTVVALVVASFGALRFFGGEREEVVVTLPADPNHKSEKQMALEAQQSGQQAAPTVDSGERDLSGAMGGGGPVGKGD